mgnify:CR=1 FL=1
MYTRYRQGEGGEETGGVSQVKGQVESGEDRLDDDQDGGSNQVDNATHKRRGQGLPEDNVLDCLCFCVVVRRNTYNVYKYICVCVGMW